MADNFSLYATQKQDGALLVAGPRMDNLSRQLLVPAKMSRRVSYGEALPTAVLDLVFTGDRIEIVKIVVDAGEDYVTTQFLTHLSLPKVIRQVALDSIPDSSHWMTDSSQVGIGLDSYDYLAQLYWFEHLSWGAPRNAVMRYAGWSRANANWHLRRMAELGLLPARTEGKAKDALGSGRPLD